MTITPLPTMANPEAFATVPELRAELHRTNHALLERHERLLEITTVVQQMGQLLSDVMAAHMAGKDDALVALLDHIQATHVRLVHKTPQGLH